MKKVLIGIVILVLVCIGYCYTLTLPVDKNNKEVITFTVQSGSTYTSISSELKNSNLIKSELVYKIYVKLLKPDTLEAGEYSLCKTYNIKEIIKKLENGASNNRETISVTFVEGKNMRYYIDILKTNFNFSEDDIISTLKDKDYLDSLINKYWFLTDDIKNDNIYYSLEGYLYPDTYEFYKSSTIKEVFESMLNNLDNKLKDYKDSVSNSKYTIHQIMTLSSIIEIEASSSSDRDMVASVFYNRLNSGWSLGSDVTTYYAEKLELWSRDLKQSEINNCNSYNTRSTCMAGKLPVGPVSNPSIASIGACINPPTSKYYYFVADKNGKTYFNETNSGHNQTVAKLKKDGLWYEY